MNPETWNPKMDVTSNVQLGTGGQSERMAMLQSISDVQEKLLTQLGPNNPIVNQQNFYNTLQSIMETGGIKDANKYFTNPAEFQAPPPAPPEPDINQRLMIRDDDRLRDKNEADVILKAAELQARYGAQVDVAQIKANADRDREMVRSLGQPGQPGQPGPGPQNV